MTYAVAAAGTGGHVFPGLAVGEALVAQGVDRSAVLYVGGDRLEATVYPEAGFPFLSVALRGLERRVALRNLGLPWVVARAVGVMTAEFRRRRVRAVLGMGGYVTIPAALAARLSGAGLAVAEQNAEAGLANRVAGRLAHRRFGAFPSTRGLAGAEWSGNPVRPVLARFERERLRPGALARYRLQPGPPVLGVFGGSLGAAALNRAVSSMVASWAEPEIQVLHLAGAAHATALAEEAARARLTWRVVGFEPEMEWFFAASDLVVARAGGAVAELAVTQTPGVLVPGGFGSGRHQEENAAVFAREGAAVVLAESELGRLGAVVGDLIGDPGRLEAMAAAAARLARPDAAERIARAMVELHG